MIDELTRRFGENEVNQAIARGINEALEEGQQLVVNDSPERTGDLKKSISIRRANPTDKVPSGAVYSDLYYAPFVEFGTKRGTKPHAMFRKNLGTIQQLVRQRVRAELMDLWNN
jgi:hypothetical protein